MSVFHPDFVCLFYNLSLFRSGKTNSESNQVLELAFKLTFLVEPNKVFAMMNLETDYVEKCSPLKQAETWPGILIKLIPTIYCDYMVKTSVQFTWLTKLDFLM